LRVMTVHLRLIASIAVPLAVTMALHVRAQTADQGAKQNIAHRGASAYAPEHTLAAYRLAMDQGAHYVEQDLAVTRDGRLICLHDDTLERTTDVATRFPDRATAPQAGRRSGPQWLAIDLTLAEIRTLDAGLWFDRKYSGSRVPTWEEALELVRSRPGIGMYPELKSPPLYRDRGIDMVKLFVESIRAHGLDRPESLRTTPVIVQSFDEPTIRRLATELPGIPRVLLMGSFPQGGLTTDRLRDIATFATGIAPAKNLLHEYPDVVERAHAAGLTVTAYTFRSRDTGRFATVRDEMSYFLSTLGIDAVFTDNPDQFPR
jgi:glycerophosphoryl diester phosphodiesterase